MSRGARSYTICAYDPGETTGWCVLAIKWAAMRHEGVKILDSIEHWITGEYVGTESDQARAMLELAESWDTAEQVVEGFALRQFNMSPSLLAPVRVAAKFEILLEDSERWKKVEAEADEREYVERSINWQPAALAMTAVTDDRQREFGLWVPGKEHARDAVKHAVTWARRAKDAMARAESGSR